MISSAKALNQRLWRDKVAGSKILESMALNREIAEAMANGNISDSQILCGPPGIGKTNVYTRTFERVGRRHTVVKSSTKLGLLGSLQKAARRKEIVILDDADEICQDLGLLQVLMTATAPANEGPRVYRHTTADGDTLFRFDGLQMVILSNFDMTILKNFPARVRKAVSALITRMHPVVLRDIDHQSIYEYSVYLAIVEDMLRTNGYSVTIANDALEFFGRNQHRLPNVSPRTLLEIAKIRKALPGSWQAYMATRFDDGFDHDEVPEDELPRIVL